MVQLLIYQGADLNYKDADGRSISYLLALENRIEMSEFLLAQGSDVEARDLEGRTALHVSAWQVQTDMVELLMNHGADVNAIDIDYRTALQSAAWQGHVSVVRLLLERNAIIDHVCNQGATALCVAAQGGHLEVVKVLLEYGADQTMLINLGEIQSGLLPKVDMIMLFVSLKNICQIIKIVEMRIISQSSSKSSSNLTNSTNNPALSPPQSPLSDVQGQRLSPVQITSPQEGGIGAPHSTHVPIVISSVVQKTANNSKQSHLPRRTPGSSGPIDSIHPIPRPTEPRIRRNGIVIQILTTKATQCTFICYT
ncbi:ankyrin repeat domain-containing protein 50 [Trichonephila inaurata madagascariensis]|uniref:Ankyrin repeat domain-containing protein 50 n=1 Tax=Trichonephila inaurata madagascariensis TaxID=2747483 RepID=A0A8X6IMM1_9ARAC|nr:ankyrin repeat domain-containing protein 50 [Trichonephila inaurata madagascariensis]